MQRKSLTLFLFILLTTFSLSACSRSDAQILKNDIPVQTEPASTNENPQKTLTISKNTFMGSERLLEIAIAAFKDKYPEWDVVLEDYGGDSLGISISVPQSANPNMAVSVNPSSPLVADAYANSVTTAVMSGGGSDIISMLGISEIEYEKAGVLVDLKPYFDTDSAINKENFSPKLLKLMETDGKLFILPLIYDVYCYCIPPNERNSEIYSGLRKKIDADGAVPWEWTWEEMATYFEPYFLESGKDYLKAAYPQDIMVEIVNNYFSILIDKENAVSNFNCDIFRKALQSVKDIQDKGYIFSVDMKSTDGTATEFLSTTGFSLDRANNLSALRTQFPDGSNLQAFAFPNVDGVTGSAFRTNNPYVYAINANSKNKDMAWEFLKVLATCDGIRNSMAVDGSRIDVGAGKEAYQDYFEAVNRGFVSEDEAKISDIEISEYSENRALFLDTINRHNTREWGELRDIIFKDTESYFAGNTTLEETVAKVDAEVQKWLDEKK